MSSPTPSPTVSAAPGDTGDLEGRFRIIIVVIVCVLGAVTISVLVFWFRAVRRRIRARELALRNSAFFDPRIPFENESLQNPAAVRLQRLWANRSGISIEELDFVAPIQPYVPKCERKEGIQDGKTPSSGNVDGACDVENVDLDGKGLNGSVVSQHSVSDNLESTCAICLEEMQPGCKTRCLPCGHEFDARCVEEWVTKANRCPICNTEPLGKEDMMRMRSSRTSSNRIPQSVSDTMSPRSYRRRRERGADGQFQIRDTFMSPALADIIAQPPLTDDINR